MGTAAQKGEEVVPREPSSKTDVPRTIGSGSGARRAMPRPVVSMGGGGDSGKGSSTASNAASVQALQACFAEEAEIERRREANLAQAHEALRTVAPDAKLVKVRSINGRLMVVVDNAVTEALRSHLFDCLETDSFRRTEFARPDTREFRHHIVEYHPQKLKPTPLYTTVDRLVQLFFPTNLEAYRIYTNAVMYGDVAFVHRDSSEDTHVTALVYPNPEWSSELGGETVFYYENGEIADAVEPRPGRIVLFHGIIMHKGSPPGRLFWGSRFTTAFKFCPDEEQNGESSVAADHDIGGGGPPPEPPPKMGNGIGMGLSTSRRIARPQAPSD